MIGIYINGNGRYQDVMNRLVNSIDTLNLSETCKKQWSVKLARYNRFYKKGEISPQLKTAVLKRYGNVGNIEMAVAAYIEDDMDKFLEKVKRICNWY